MTDAQIRAIAADISRHRAQAFAKAFVAITTAVAADVLGARLGEAMTTHAGITAKVQSDADGRTLADAVDAALADGTMGGAS